MGERRGALVSRDLDSGHGHAGFLAMNAGPRCSCTHIRAHSCPHALCSYGFDPLSLGVNKKALDW